MSNKEFFKISIETVIEVTIDDIQPRNHNLSKGRNPNFSNIKTSILKSGLINRLKVTLRSPDEPLMIKGGGNTRLEILRELWMETGDEKFYRMKVDFEPWTNEIDVLASHKKENMHRGKAHV